MVFVTQPSFRRKKERHGAKSETAATRARDGGDTNVTTKNGQHDAREDEYEAKDDKGKRKTADAEQTEKEKPAKKPTVAKREEPEDSGCTLVKNEGIGDCLAQAISEGEKKQKTALEVRARVAGRLASAQCEL